MSGLREIFEKSLESGKVDYSYFNGENINKPFNQYSFDYPESSKQPYIRLGIDPKNQFDTTDPTGLKNRGLAIIRDEERLGKWFLDGNQGLLYTLKQEGLHLSNPDVSYKAVEGSGGLDTLQSVQGPRLYNPLSVNANIATAPLGIHTLKHVSLNTDPQENSGYLTLNSEGSEFQSRLLLYADKLLDKNTEGNILLNEYIGGPNSLLGAGRTRIFSYGERFGLNTGETDKDALYPESKPIYQGFTPWSYREVSAVSEQNSKANIEDASLFKHKPVNDFRKVQDRTYSKNIAKNYELFNIHNRTGVTEARGTGNKTDSINVLKIRESSDFYRDENKPYTSAEDQIYAKGYDKNSVLEKIGGTYGRDLVKMRIEALNNDEPIKNSQYNADVITFRSYISSFSDQMTPKWKSFNYMGRGEDFHVYEGFTRTLNITFDIFAHSGEEMAPIYTKLNYLMSTFTPDYTQAGKMRGTYHYLTVGDYIYRQPGVITSFNIGRLLDAPWETAVNAPLRNDNGEYDLPGAYKDSQYHHEVPKLLSVTLGFIPIYDFLPQRVPKDKHIATFITPNWRVWNKDKNRYLPTGGDIDDSSIEPEPILETTTEGNSTEEIPVVTPERKCTTYKITNVNSVDENIQVGYIECGNDETTFTDIIKGGDITVCVWEGTVEPSPFNIESDYTLEILEDNCTRTPKKSKDELPPQEVIPTVYPLMYLDGTTQGVSYKALQASGATQAELDNHLAKKKEEVKIIQNIFKDRYHRLMFYLLRCNRTMPELGPVKLYDGPSIDGIFGPATEFLVYQALKRPQVLKGDGVDDVATLSAWYAKFHKAQHPLIYNQSPQSEKLKELQTKMFPGQKKLHTGNYGDLTKAKIIQTATNYAINDGSTPDEWNNLTVDDYVIDYNIWGENNLVTGSSTQQPTSPYNVYAPCYRTDPDIYPTNPPGYPASEKYFILTGFETLIYYTYLS